jgi:hypothetical protein
MCPFPPLEPLSIIVSLAQNPEITGFKMLLPTLRRGVGECTVLPAVLTLLCCKMSAEE